jgi:hypothetical protein
MPVNPVEYDPDDLVLTISWARSAKPRVRHAISLSPANPLTSEVLPETFPAAWKFWWWGRL